jgi:hypothetical protein
LFHLESLQVLVEDFLHIVGQMTLTDYA